jgi:hypothetical protein
MRHCIKSILTVTLLSFAVISSESFALSNFSCGNTRGQLTEQQCAKLRQDLQTYIALITKYFGTGPLVQLAIKVANRDVDRLCPQQPPVDDGNHYSADSPFECKVVDTSGTLSVSLGINNDGTLTNSGSPDRVVCASQFACQNIVSQKYSLLSLSSSSRCADPNDNTVLHLTDEEVQTKINAVP